MKTANKPLMSTDFNFKEWAELAETDPARFEARRKRVLNETIRRFPDDRHEMLHRLQWKVDRVRELKKTPLAATIAISGLMWDSFNELHRGYVDLAAYKPGQKPPVESKPSAKVIEFRKAEKEEA
ncbi:MAG: DUF3135 domain-containing protein [Gammaproteobacteria bacterium]|nr:DUF3135 domain-containing protein [Gammaproteobacteria bacterium]